MELVAGDLWATKYQRWLEKVDAALRRSGRPGVLGWDYDHEKGCEVHEEQVWEVCELMELDDPWKDVLV